MSSHVYDPAKHYNRYAGRSSHSIELERDRLKRVAKHQLEHPDNGDVTIHKLTNDDRRRFNL